MKLAPTFPGVEEQLRANFAREENARPPKRFPFAPRSQRLFLLLFYQ